MQGELVTIFTEKNDFTVLTEVVYDQNGEK